MNINQFFLLPLAMVIAAVFSLSGVYLGLKWNVQLQKGETPTVELPKLPNPLAVIQERRETKEVANILDEYLNGPKEVK